MKLEQLSFLTSVAQERLHCYVTDSLEVGESRLEACDFFVNRCKGVWKPLQSRLRGVS